MRLFAWCRVFSPWEKRREGAQRKVDFFSWVDLVSKLKFINLERNYYYFFDFQPVTLLIGCVPLKTGCTSWIFGQTIGPELGNEILTGPDGTRFLVTRHPLLRFFSGFRQKFKRNDPLHKKLLKKSNFLREKAEIHMANFDDDMTIEFGDFAHYMGSKISPSTIFNSHFRPQFYGCKGRFFAWRPQTGRSFEPISTVLGPD